MAGDPTARTGSRLAPGDHALVVGAGVGGLAFAAALARRGGAVTVLERAGGLGDVGAGLQVTPNGMRVLDALGLGPEAEAASVPAEAVEAMDALTGARVARFDLARAGRYRFMRRSSLIGLLAAGAAGAGAEIRLGRPVEGVEAAGLRTGHGVVPARWIVGADGVRSVVRPWLCGAEAPTFTGQAAWRAVVEAEGHPPAARVWMAPGRHVVTYPLPGGALNVVAVREEAAWSAEGWDHADEPARLLAAFADAGPPLRHVLERIAETRRWGLFRRPLAARWQDGRVALLGDAAHPTLPFLAQGANLALEDAWVLARLVEEGRVGEYEQLRRARVARALDEADANARRYHLRGPARAGARLGLRLLAATAPNAFLRRLDWLYGFDATA